MLGEAYLQKPLVKSKIKCNFCILVEKGIDFGGLEPPGAPWPPGVPDAFQMPAEYLPDASQMPLASVIPSP